MTKHDMTLDAERTPTTSPVDDRTYNVLQALTSTLEALDAYQVYAEDDPGGVFEDLIADEQRHAARLVDELRSCLAPAR